MLSLSKEIPRSQPGYRRNCKTFPDDMVIRTPNKIKAIQIEGGSEFKSVFEDECRKRGILLLPPRSLKLNGRVERANRTDTEEFYEIVDSTVDPTDIRPKLIRMPGYGGSLSEAVSLSKPTYG